MKKSWLLILLPGGLVLLLLWLWWRARQPGATAGATYISPAESSPAIVSAPTTTVVNQPGFLGSLLGGGGAGVSGGGINVDLTGAVKSVLNGVESAFNYLTGATAANQAGASLSSLTSASQGGLNPTVPWSADSQAGAGGTFDPNSITGSDDSSFFDATALTPDGGAGTDINADTGDVTAFDTSGLTGGADDSLDGGDFGGWTGGDDGGDDGGGDGGGDGGDE